MFLEHSLEYRILRPKLTTLTAHLSDKIIRMKYVVHFTPNKKTRLQDIKPLTVREDTASRLYLALISHYKSCITDET